MKRYNHDYTKVIQAESLLFKAYVFLANECYDDAKKRIIESRQLLQEYLSQDNMVENDDVTDGWCKALDVKKLEDALDYLI